MAFQQLVSTGSLGQRQLVVLESLRLFPGGATDRMLVKATGLTINQVTPRRGELVKMGFVYDDGLCIDPITRKQNILWRKKDEI